MKTEVSESTTVRDLTSWFQDKLEHSDVHWDDEPLSYDGNTPYDIQFYRLQTEAAQFWQERYGYTPTPGQLMQSFFGAEYLRSRQRRLASRSWREKIQTWCEQARGI